MMKNDSVVRWLERLLANANQFCHAQHLGSVAHLIYFIKWNTLLEFIVLVLRIYSAIISLLCWWCTDVKSFVTRWGLLQTLFDLCHNALTTLQISPHWGSTSLLKHFKDIFTRFRLVTLYFMQVFTRLSQTSFNCLQTVHDYAARLLKQNQETRSHFSY